MKCREIMANMDYFPVEHDRKFVTTIMYRELRGNKVKVDWRKNLCDNNARQRAKFTF